MNNYLVAETLECLIDYKLQSYKELSYELNDFS